MPVNFEIRLLAQDSSFFAGCLSIIDLSAAASP